MAKKIIVTGASGLVGSRFVELNSKYQLLTPEYPDFDLTDIAKLSSYLEQEKPDLILNLAAFTDVTAAESQTGDEKGSCWQINVEGVKNLLSFAIPLIHISTDMVFSGSEEDPGPYEEDHPTPDDPRKLTWYGWTKNRAEKLVLEKDQTVVRIIYPVRVKYDLKKDYLRGPLSMFAQGKLYPLFDDQQVSITFIDELVEALNIIIDRNLKGIFHVSTDTLSVFELVSYAIDQLGGDSSTIQRASIKPFLEKQQNPYRYPIKGGLDSKKTQADLGLTFKTWRQVVDELISQGLSI